MGRTCSLEPEEFLHELGSDEGIRVFTQAWVQLVARRDDVAHALDAHELDRRAGGVCRLPAVDNGVGEKVGALWPGGMVEIRQARRGPRRGGHLAASSRLSLIHI